MKLAFEMVQTTVTKAVKIVILGAQGSWGGEAHVHRPVGVRILR